jgi:hypothetical protein
MGNLADMVPALICLLALPAQDIRVSSVSEIRQALANAKPGQRIQVAPGVYRAGFSFSGLAGKAGAPIVISGADPKQRPRFSGLHFSRIAYVEFRDLVIENATGNGINIDDGGSGPASHHVKLSNIHVTRTPQGNVDGIKLSGLEDFELRNCTVENWGGSAVDMVGCHRGLIEGCTFLRGGDSGVQGKGGSSDVTVRGCRFEHAGQRSVNLGGSTGAPFFRPPLAAMPANGRYEARNLIVERCTFVGSTAPIAFVGVDGASVRFNTFYMPERWALRILQESAGPEFLPCRNGTFADNIVVFRSDKWASGGVNVGPNTAPQTFKFERNWWFCADRPAASRPSLPAAEIRGVYGTDPMFVDAPAGDLRLREESPAKGRGA